MSPGSRRQGGVAVAGILLLVLSAASLGCHRPRTADQATRPKNLLWIVVDTLRADRLGCYGGPVATPNLDRLAETGVRFDHAYSHIPITGPSHATMFTGELPLQHGVRNNTEVLGEGRTTIAEILKAHGFHTAGVVSLGNLRRQFGFAQGFDRFNQRFSTEWFRPANKITDAALGIVRGIEQGPFFLFVHYSDPHEPYSPPTGVYPKVEVALNGTEVGTVRADGYGKRVPVLLQPGRNRVELKRGPDGGKWRFVFRYLGTTDSSFPVQLGRGWSAPAGEPPSKTLLTGLPAHVDVTNSSGEAVQTDLKFFVEQEIPLAEERKRYNEEIAYVDGQIGRLLKALEARGDLRDTLIVFNSDHGEGMGDHDLVGHVQQLYNSLLHVPLVFSGSGVKDPRVVEAPVGLVDLLPTLLEELGIERPPNLVGRDILDPIGQGTRSLLAMTFTPEAKRDLMAVVTDRYKLIVDVSSGDRELYDLVADPQELTNIDSSHRDVERPLARELRAALEAANARSQSGPLSEDERHQLEALGYVQ